MDGYVKGTEYGRSTARRYLCGAYPTYDDTLESSVESCSALACMAS